MKGSRAMAAIVVVFVAAACEEQTPSANSAWGAKPNGTKSASPKEEPLALHAKFGADSTDWSTTPVGPAGTRTREAAMNGAQTPDANDCVGKSDGAAKCAGSTLHVCVGAVEYTLDCDKFAQNDGWDNGDCVQTDAIVDCFGCEAKGGASRACCDAMKRTACCDESGACWKP